MIYRVLTFAFAILFRTAMLYGQEQSVEVFTTVPYERYIIYEALVLFWAGIAGLVVIIAMKLREIKRTQDLGIDKDEKDAPFLD